MEGVVHLLSTATAEVYTGPSAKNGPVSLLRWTQQSVSQHLHVEHSEQVSALDDDAKPSMYKTVGADPAALRTKARDVPHERAGACARQRLC